MAESLETLVVRSDRIDIPAEIKKKLHLKKGDRIIWTYEGDRLVAEVVKKKKGSLSSLVGKFSGEPSDSVRSHNLTGTH
jgi:bifunctional DNA-binding transcriptional regulator/antitoxin component of YhaV-PrlF toxin-antitoxin module